MKRKILTFLLVWSFLISPTIALAYASQIIVGGENIGIHIDSGILIIGFYKVNGKYLKAQPEIEIGDMITKVETKEVNTIEELTSAIDEFLNEEEIHLTCKRNNQEFTTTLHLENVNNVYKTGLYVKDGISGIGTLTYIDPETKVFGILGHEIIESNTKTRIEVKEGTIFQSDVTKIIKSENGKVGEKNATLHTEQTLGIIQKNTLYGVFGTYESPVMKEHIMPVGKEEEVKLGKASIYTVLEGNQRKEYEITIKKINHQSDIKNITFEITDPELLAKTGGVIQGMSGSPIIQNGKIIGAVTHAIVDDVKLGYGIFITTVLEKGEE